MEKILDFIKKGLGFVLAFFAGVLAVILRSRLRDNGKRTESAGDRLDTVSNDVGECGKELGAVQEEIIDARKSVESGISIIEKVRARKRIDN